MSVKFATREQEREVLAWIIRKFPEGRIPVGDGQYVVEHTDELSDMLLAMMASCRSYVTPAEPKLVSDWQKIFGHLQVLDSNFNESHYPLEPEDQLREVVEKRFRDTATGYARLQWAESQGLVQARPRATGLYLQAHPELQLTSPVVSGGRWRCGDSDGCVPVFSRDDVGRPSVSLHWLDRVFRPHCVWLFSRK